MLIFSSENVQQWVADGITDTVSKWFNANSGQTIAACATANNLTYAQVSWALWQSNASFFALPEQDSELWAGLLDKSLRS